MRRRLLELKFLIPATVLLWLAVSFPFFLLMSRAQAEVVSDPACAGSGEDPTAGVWGQPGHLTVIEPCFKVSGHLVYGEWWRGSSRDGDGNHYMELDDQYENLVTSSDRTNLRLYAQAQGTADLLGEIIPDDQSEIPFYCLNSDLGVSNYQPSNPCDGSTDWVEWVGVFAYDNNHGYKEIHPINKQSDGTKTCSRVQPCNGSTGDTTPPTLSSVSPNSGARKVSRGTDVKATFSEDIDPATLTTSTFTLVKSSSTTPISASVKYDSTSRTATLNPYGSSSTNLKRCTSYKATVKSGVEDKAGNPLGSDNAWSFKTKGC
jgi:hypothetical protein